MRLFCGGGHINQGHAGFKKANSARHYFKRDGKYTGKVREFFFSFSGNTLGISGSLSSSLQAWVLSGLAYGVALRPNPGYLTTLSHDLSLRIVGSATIHYRITPGRLPRYHY